MHMVQNMAVKHPAFTEGTDRMEPMLYRISGGETMPSCSLAAGKKSPEHVISRVDAS